jgi:methylthioribose-1-phosphate isomerase
VVKIGDQHYRSIWRDGHKACIIDQTRLPFEFEIIELTSLKQACHAIKSMQVRGAPLIGATAAYGMAIAVSQTSSLHALQAAYQQLHATRPTAINLRWALNKVKAGLEDVDPAHWRDTAWQIADQICEQDIASNQAIGQYGFELIEAIANDKPGQAINILTHCNAGALATVDWGTALAPIYTAHNRGLDVHVWVDETRPRNQGASLTAWELGQHGVPHTIISDNSGGHLMQHGQVDICLVGSDRTTASGDVCNKIGTYLKALAAKDNAIPFYACVPASTIDWSMHDGLKEIPIEERHAEELTHVRGRNSQGVLHTVQISAPNSQAANHAFDVTPAKLVSGIITEYGVFAAEPATLHQLKGQLSDV